MLSSICFTILFYFILLTCMNEMIEYSRCTLINTKSFEHYPHIIHRATKIDRYFSLLGERARTMFRSNETRSFSNELHKNARARGVRFGRRSSTCRKVKARLFGSLASGERADRLNWSKNENNGVDIASCRAASSRNAAH